MASQVVVFLALLCFTAPLVQAGLVATYWGQDGNEGDLSQACSSGNYGIIMLAFLSTFGNGQQPQLNLAGHCDPPSGTCARFASQIQACQQQGIKVLLSIGGADGSYGLSSSSDADNLADHIWNTYLGGNSGSRPLGSAVLDGVDFDIERGGTPQLYIDLANGLRSRGARLLSAAPQCPIPDANLGSAVQTSGLFDYVFVQFYNNPDCQYNGDTTNLINSWNNWVSDSTTSSGAKVFMGLPASTAARGFMPSDVLISQVLPQIKSSSKYGGVMIWNVAQDNGYSAAIKSSV